MKAGSTLIITFDAASSIALALLEAEGDQGAAPPPVTVTANRRLGAAGQGGQL